MGRFLEVFTENRWRHCLPAIHQSQDVCSRLFGAAMTAGGAFAGIACGKRIDIPAFKP
jgi:hypothetical protein